MWNTTNQNKRPNERTNNNKNGSNREKQKRKSEDACFTSNITRIDECRMATFIHTYISYNVTHGICKLKQFHDPFWITHNNRWNNCSRPHQKWISQFLTKKKKHKRKQQNRSSAILRFLVRSIHVTGVNYRMEVTLHFKNSMTKNNTNHFTLKIKRTST